VAERLTANPGISGRIAIDSRGSVVYLSGYTLTAAQAQRAEREARRVRGVRVVRNEIRARVGGSY
jgi:osmotically-inducible protein OsmY